jgi:hypothetical protein
VAAHPPNPLSFASVMFSPVAVDLCATYLWFFIDQYGYDAMVDDDVICDAICDAKFHLLRLLRHELLLQKYTSKTNYSRLNIEEN